MVPTVSDKLLSNVILKDRKSKRRSKPRGPSDKVLHRTADTIHTNLSRVANVAAPPVCRFPRWKLRSTDTCSHTNVLCDERTWRHRSSQILERHRIIPDDRTLQRNL